MQQLISSPQDTPSPPPAGRHSAGVSRRYCGQRGKINNCQVETSNQLLIFDRPDFPLDRILYKLDSIKHALPDKALQRKAIDQLSAQGDFGYNRIALGKKFNKDAGLFINDDKGKPRIMIYVDKENRPHIRFYDEKGAVTAELPEAAKVN